MYETEGFEPSNGARMSAAGEGLTEPHNSILESCHPRRWERHPTGCLFFGADKDSNLFKCEKAAVRWNGLLLFALQKGLAVDGQLELKA